MFNGLVRSLGCVVNSEATMDIQTLVIDQGSGFETMEIGSSIAINGVCLTLVRVVGKTIHFDIAGETSRITTLSMLSAGDVVHLEPSLVLGSSIDGHFVFGHIDCMGEIIGVVDENGTWKFSFSVPPEHSRYIARKGSIAIDGISLTVGDIRGASFDVYIIPHTYDQTRFRYYKKGQFVNIELDPLARYVVRYLETGAYV